MGRPLKTSAEDRAAILQRLAGGASVLQAARDYSISRASVIAIRDAVEHEFQNGMRSSMFRPLRSRWPQIRHDPVAGSKAIARQAIHSFMSSGSDAAAEFFRSANALANDGFAWIREGRVSSFLVWYPKNVYPIFFSEKSSAKAKAMPKMCSTSFFVVVHE